MTADQIVHLIVGLVGGGGLVALINHLFLRDKTQAETMKTKAEAEKLKAEAARILSEVSVTTAVVAASERDQRLPKGWIKAGSNPSDYDMGVDEHANYGGHRGAYIRAHKASHGFGTLMQIFKADKYKGRRLKFSGAARADGVEDWAGFWMRMDSPKKRAIRFDNMENRPISGSTGWTKYQIVLDVPDEATDIAFGVLLGGNGRIWIADLRFDIVDATTPTTDITVSVPDEPVNLQFEE